MENEVNKAFESNLNIHDSHLGKFETFSLVEFDFINPTKEMIREVDMAHALSQMCRFGCHSTKSWTVAEHSILVAALCPNEIRREAILHDAPETWLGDVIKPLKNIIAPIYEPLEANIMKLIIEMYGLDTGKLFQVKKYDKIALELEHKAFKLKNEKEEGFIRSLIDDLLFNMDYAFNTSLHLNSVGDKYMTCLNHYF